MARAKTEVAGVNGDMPELESKDLFKDVESPYAIRFEIVGVKTYFFARPDVDEFEAKESSAPGSRRRKETNFETLVWRDEKGQLAFPSTQLKTALMMAGRYMPDPSKTGRRSARPFIAEAVSISEELCTFLNGDGLPYKSWDHIDSRLARYRNGSMGPRRRPVLYAGWRAVCTVEVLVPELIAPGDITILMNRAGLVRGIGDNATFGYGRFTVAGIGTAQSLNW